ncbi:AraC family transcriptional regulator [Bacteroides ihuae]|uniref:AraC family transcriptional regulator n=1 Tax=Bacteroides ihuae TaxID=1852362 RepID=UPI0008DAAE86|nr:AraC family transcriptional regulator [Bacteroides ihuae]
MKNIFLFLVFSLLFILFPSLHAQDQSQNSDNLNERISYLRAKKNDGYALKELSFLYLARADYTKAISFAEQLRKFGEINAIDYFRLYSYIYLGQGLMMKGYKKPAKFYLNKSLLLAQELKNDSALCSVYNGLGLYSSNIEMDYYRSIFYFFKGIEVARKGSNDQLQSLLLSNLSGIYYLMNDTTGLKYALECYELGHKRSDTYTIMSGAMNSAYMYYLKGNYIEASKYAKEAEFIMLRNGFHDQSNVYNLLGYISTKQGDNVLALSYFEKALELQSHAQTSSVVNAYLGYSKVLISKGDYDEAIPLLKKGISISNDRNSSTYRHLLYQTLSNCYERKQDYAGALEYYKKYRVEKDSILTEEKERSLNELRIKYDVEKQENEIAHSKLRLLQNEKKVQFLTFGFLLIFVALGFIYYLYIRKNRLFLKIVEQNQDAIRREENLRFEIRRLKNEEQKDKVDVTGKYAASSLTDEKTVELYYLLNQLMLEKKVYKDHFITKEKVADMLDTNRTYLSQVINEQSGKTFTHYINSFRVEEAVRVLSDANNNIPLKALSSELGFNSISTFYNVFQSAVGMPPSLYRSKVLSIQKGRQ